MNRFKRMRFELGLTQRQLAEKANVSRTTVLRLERGEDPSLTGPVAHGLAKAYGISVAELVAPEQVA